MTQNTVFQKISGFYPKSGFVSLLYKDNYYKISVEKTNKTNAQYLKMCWKRNIPYNFFTNQKIIDILTYINTHKKETKRMKLYETNYAIIYQYTNEFVYSIVKYLGKDYKNKQPSQVFKMITENIDYYNNYVKKFIENNFKYYDDSDFDLSSPLMIDVTEKYLIYHHWKHLFDKEDANINYIWGFVTIRDKNINHIRDLNGSHIELLREIRNKLVDLYGEIIIKLDMSRIMRHQRFELEFYSREVERNIDSLGCQNNKDTNFTIGVYGDFLLGYIKLEMLIKNLMEDPDYYKNRTLQYKVYKYRKGYELAKQ